MSEVFRYSQITSFDLLFVLCAISFNFLIAGVFIAMKQGRPRLVRTIGVLLLSLALPLAIVFINYLMTGKPSWVLVNFGFIFLYLFVELLLDYVIKYDFRAEWSTHIPYIVLEYLALFGLIGISFAIGESWGFLVSISFWIMMGCLIYLYWGARKVVEG